MSPGLLQSMYTICALGVESRYLQSSCCSLHTIAKVYFLFQTELSSIIQLKTRLDHIRNEDIRKEADVKPVATFLENKRLKWFGHCLRRERKHICAKSLRLEVSGRRSRGRPKKEMEGQHTGRHEEIPTD